VTAFAPRKLPQQDRAKDTLDAILTAALQVLDQNGHEPGVRSIADRAGVSVGSLYQYFPSKQSLANAVVRHHLRRNLAATERELEAASGLPAEEAAARLVDGLIGDKRAHVKLEAAMIRYFCRVGDLMVLTELDEQVNALVEKFIASLGKQVRPVDTGIAAFLVANTLRSAVLLTLVQRPERLHDPVFRSELIQLIVRYLRP
jgi:AcrR family transcriptional regulator